MKFEVVIVLLERGESVIWNVTKTVTCGVIKEGGVNVCVCGLVIQSGKDACLYNVGRGWLDVPVWVPVMCVNFQKFMDKVMSVSIEPWGSGPLTLLLKISKVRVLPRIKMGGSWGSGFKCVG
jgi:hypothetical protein